MVIRKIKDRSVYFSKMPAPMADSKCLITKADTGFIVRLKSNGREVGRFVLCRDESCYRKLARGRSVGYCPNNHNERECLDEAIRYLNEIDRIISTMEKPEAKQDFLEAQIKQLVKSR